MTKYFLAENGSPVRKHQRNISNTSNESTEHLRKAPKKSRVPPAERAAFIRAARISKFDLNAHFAGQQTDSETSSAYFGAKQSYHEDSQPACPASNEKKYKNCANSPN